MPIEKSVQEWDLSSYPDMDPRDGKPASDYFKLAFLTANGDVAFSTITEKIIINNRTGESIDKVKKGQPRTWDVRGGGSPMVVTKKRGAIPGENIPKVSQIKPHDIRRAEQMIQGKPSVVRMGLWHRPELSEDGEVLGWVEQDRRKNNVPPFWLDVTDSYYQWRAKAYEKFPDPYKNQKRPYTRIQELEIENSTLASAAEKEIAKLRADLEKAKAKK